MRKKSGRRLVIGDVHGQYKALKQVLKKSNFDYDNDTLICLGDVCDGFGTPKVKECYDELLKIKNLIYILGNHDYWAKDWMNNKYTGRPPFVWTSQGGIETMRSYGMDSHNVPDTHKALLNYEAKYYYLTQDNILFVHGGIDPDKPLEENTHLDMMWDRELISYAKKNVIGDYKQVFVGHTPTIALGYEDKPQQFNNLTMMDTGADVGRVTIMDVDTREYWQSEKKGGF